MTGFSITVEKKKREDGAKNSDLGIISVEIAVEIIKVEGINEGYKGDIYNTYNNKDKF